MYQIGIDIGGTNVKIGLLDASLTLAAEGSIPFPHTTAEDMAQKGYDYRAVLEHYYTGVSFGQLEE